MPGPTIEVLNDDLKTLREDFHRFSIEVREDNHKLGLEVRVLATKVNFIVGLAALIVVAVGSGIGAGIWWAATLSADVKHLATEVATSRVYRETPLKSPEGVVVPAPQPKR